MTEFSLEGEEFITLQSLLKASGLCDTGGDAKNAIISGQVMVDDVIETRRGKKMRPGQKASFKTKTVIVTA